LELGLCKKEKNGMSVAAVKLRKVAYSEVADRKVTRCKFTMCEVADRKVTGCEGIDCEVAY
jgi:hypothetical protein